MERRHFGRRSRVAVRRNDLFERLYQRRQILVQDLPEDVEIDGIVAVNETIAQRDNLTPRYLRILGTLVYWHSAGRLAHDFEEPNQGEIHFAIDVEIRAGLARNHRNSLSRVIQNVAESHQALMARHTGPRLRESLRENCIRISYSLYLPCRTGPSTNISLREVIPTLPNSWRASPMRKTSRMQ